MKDDMTSRNTGSEWNCALPSQRHQNLNCQQKFNVETNPKNYMAGRVRGPSDPRPTYYLKLLLFIYIL